jgi:hypothetical protein
MKKKDIPSFHTQHASQEEWQQPQHLDPDRGQAMPRDHRHFTFKVCIPLCVLTYFQMGQSTQQ